MAEFTRLQRNIMRRVYYAYTLRIATHPALISAVLFVAGVYGLSVMVHVASIIENILALQVGSLPEYIFNALVHAELFTLVFLGIIIFSLLSFRISIRPIFKHTYQAV